MSVSENVCGKHTFGCKKLKTDPIKFEEFLHTDAYSATLAENTSAFKSKARDSLTIAYKLQ